jgi:phenylpyruvate tautomerase PptA (4-oxalocrotonate tautomerase family)
MPTVIIYWSPTRSDEQKRQVAQGITQTLVQEGAAKLEDVLIIFQNIEAGDAARAGRMLNGPTAHPPQEGSD